MSGLQDFLGAAVLSALATLVVVGCGAAAYAIIRAVRR